MALSTSRAERDDQRGQGDLIDTDAEERQHRQRHDDRHRDQARHDDAGPQSEERQSHHQHEGDGLKQVHAERADQRVDGLGLERHHVELDADRRSGPKAVEGVDDPLAERGRVAAVAHRDADREGGGAGGENRAGRRLDMLARDVGQVLEVDHLGTPGQGDDGAPQGVDGPEVAGRLHHNPLRIDQNVAGVADGIDVLEDRAELERGQTQLGEPRVVVFDEEPLGPRPVDVHPRDVVHQDEVFAQPLGHRLQLGVRIVFAGNGDQNAEDVLGVGHGRSDDAGREVRRRLLHPPSQAVHDGLQLVELASNLDHDGRHAGPGCRNDVVDLGDLPNRRLDPVRHQLLHAVRAHAGTDRHHLHDARRERGILGVLHFLVGHQAGAEHHQQGDGRDPVLLDGGAGGIHG